MCIYKSIDSSCDLVVQCADVFIYSHNSYPLIGYLTWVDRVHLLLKYNPTILSSHRRPRTGRESLNTRSFDFELHFQVLTDACEACCLDFGIPLKD